MKMVYLFLGSIVAAAAVGGVRSMAGTPDHPARDPAPIAATPQAAQPGPSEPVEAPAAEAITGEVLEVIDVPSYSYLRIGPKGSEGTWAAVPSAKLAVGTRVSVQNPMKMTDFKSTALGRTFPVIFFGTLAGGGSPHGAAAMNAPNPHANGADPHAAAANPHGANGADPHAGFAADPHGGSLPPASTGPSPVEVKPVPRAAGPHGKTVAEVIGQRTQLDGKPVRVRGTVVKVTSGVLGRTYLHLRDGSGEAAAGTNDLTVTTEATPMIGETIEIEGKVAIDRDIGSGYKFPTLVEDAKILK